MNSGLEKQILYILQILCLTSLNLKRVHPRPCQKRFQGSSPPFSDSMMQLSTMAKVSTCSSAPTSIDCLPNGKSSTMRASLS